MMKIEKAKVNVNVDTQSIVEKFSSPYNSSGLGKLVYLKETNETVITNGKSLVSFSNSKLSNNHNVTDEEEYRLNSLVTKLIHNNYGEHSLCELMLTKSDVNDLLDFVYNNLTSTIELVYNKQLQVLLLKVNNCTFVKIIPSNNINKFKSKDASVTVDAVQLYNVLDVVTEHVRASSQIALAIQADNRPLIIESDKVKSCISCIK